MQIRTANQRRETDSQGEEDDEYEEYFNNKMAEEMDIVEQSSS